MKELLKLGRQIPLILAGFHAPNTGRFWAPSDILAGRCELCGREGTIQVHDIRKLADIDRPGRRPRTKAEKIMAARRRKTLVVCLDCHRAIHSGRYDGPSLRSSLESRMR